MSANSAVQPLKARQATLICLAAYLLWGVFPIFFKLLETAPAAETVAHRVVWSVVFSLLLIAYSGKQTLLWQQLLCPQKLKITLLAGYLIVGNWVVFVWAVAQDRILETSLGYYLSPLLTVLLGSLFLKERLGGIKKIAFLLCLFGLAHKIMRYQAFPYIALLVAFSFSGYSLVKKKQKTDSLVSFSSEIMVTVPFALAALGYFFWSGTSLFNSATTFQLTLSSTAFVTVPAWQLALVFSASGMISMAPLLLYTYSIKFIQLSLAGFMQYLTPSASFLIAIFLYDEPFVKADFLTLGPIWVSLLLCSFEKQLSAAVKTVRKKILGGA